MRLALVVGTRPQLVKAAALLPELPGCLFVDTGQHWDGAMAGSFFDELGLPRPDHSLAIGRGSVGTMIEAIEAVLRAERPDVVLVVGDTRSSLAAAVAASSIPGMRVAHLEAGLRSFDRTMPEEVARVVVDHLAYRNFAPTRRAEVNLLREGAVGVEVVGDVLADVVERFLQPARTLPVPFEAGTYILATIHRAANRAPHAIESWLGILADAPLPVVLALHPGTRVALGERVLPPNVLDIGPVGYRDSLVLQLHAAAVITDSGVVEREASWLGTPVVLLRDCSEWPELASACVGLRAERARAALELRPQRPVRIPSGAARRVAASLGYPAVVRSAA
jgi:UDP-N-acetylglucosamine 2-epimerase